MVEAVIVGVLSVIFGGLLIVIKKELVYGVVNLAVWRLRDLPLTQRDELRAEWFAEVDLFYSRGRALSAFGYAVSLFFGVSHIRTEMTELLNAETGTDEITETSISFVKKLVKVLFEMPFGVKTGMLIGVIIGIVIIPALSPSLTALYPNSYIFVLSGLFGGLFTWISNQLAKSLIGLLEKIDSRIE